MGIFSGGGSGGGLPGVTVSGAAAASKALIATSSSAATWSYPPGFEIGYDQITTTAAIHDTSEATATALIQASAYTFDGGPVICEFFCDCVVTDNLAAGDQVIVTLFEGATQITRLGLVRTIVVASRYEAPMYAAFRFTPTAGSHTYKICGFVTSDNNAVLTAGSGGTAGHAPAYIRFVKV